MTEIKETKKVDMGHLCLLNYTENYKIRCIKLIRNMSEDYKNMKVKFNLKKIGLREAKDYCENENIWDTKPLAYGPIHDIEFLCNVLERDYEDIRFKVMPEFPTELNMTFKQTSDHDTFKWHKNWIDKSKSVSYPNSACEAH